MRRSPTTLLRNRLPLTLGALLFAGALYRWIRQRGPRLRFTEELSIDAPLSAVQDSLLRIDQFPRFMSFIERVEPDAQGHLIWTGRSPITPRIPLHFRTELACHSRTQGIAWRALSGEWVQMSGFLQAEPISEFRTRVHAGLSLDSPVKGWAGVAAQWLGLQPSATFHQDLRRLRTLLEHETQALRSPTEQQNSAVAPFFAKPLNSSHDKNPFGKAAG